jgi:hypothetical protein
MNERVRRLQGRVAGVAPAGPGPSPGYELFLKLLNNARIEGDRADREAQGNPDFDFGDGPPEPEPLTEAEERSLDEEPVSGGEGWYLDMLLELRAEIPDSHPKAGIMDTAIAAERKTTERNSDEGTA